MSYKKIRILFVTGFYPPNSGGTGVVINNLLKGLQKEIIAGVATKSTPVLPKFDEELNIPICHLFRFKIFSRFERIIRKIYFRSQLFKLKKFAVHVGATHIVGVYPDVEFLSLAIQCSDSLKLRFIPYLHDTIKEGLSHTFYKYEAINLQKNIFKRGAPILVMSNGMKDLYKKKYNIDSIPVLHSYPEISTNLPFESNLIQNNIFWGGAIYSINKNSFRRIVNSRVIFSLKMEISSSLSLKELKKNRIITEGLSIKFYSRKEYIQALRTKGFLLLALDWPNESIVHEDELSTIFPTKTIEYLASGRPIIVHCPNHYYLSKFFRKFDCGFIIDSKDEQEIHDKMTFIFSDVEGQRKKIQNALEVLKLFSLEKVAGEFMKAIYSTIPQL